MAPWARNKFGAPMFKPEVFREANVLYWRKCWWHCWDFSVSHAVIWRPIVIRRQKNCVPPSLRPWLCSSWLKPCPANYIVGNTSSNKANFRKTLTALDPSLTIRVNKIWHRLDHRFGSRWKVPEKLMLGICTVAILTQLLSCVCFV